MEDWILRIAALTGAVVAVIAAVWKGWNCVHTFIKRIDQFIDDWNGEPARQGFAGRPGFLERLSYLETSTIEMQRNIQAINAELHPNGGSSLRDSVNRIEKNLGI